MLDPINSVLEYTCPHCAAVDCDTWEVLDLDRPVQLRCGACGNGFTLLTIECAVCERDIVGTWINAAQARPAALPALCAACAARSSRHEVLATNNHEAVAQRR
jgi:hypothetical protein